MTLAALLAAITRRALLRTLRLTGGSRAATAAALDVSPSTLQRLLRAHVPADELAALDERLGWTRADICAHARAAPQRR